MITDSASSVFGKVGEARRLDLFAKGCPRDLARGEYLFFKGDPARRVWAVERGVMKLSLVDATGRPSLLGVVGPGDIIGELAAADGYGQPYDAVAATPVVLTSFDADDAMSAILSSSDAAAELCAQLASRTRSVLGAVDERAGDVTARIAGRLLELADLLGRMRSGTIEMEVPLAQEDIGRLAGMCRESACRTMRQLKADGVLDYRGRKMRILRPDVLERLRCGGRAARPSR